MEVKLGYKQTEVGVIPEEWGVVELRSVCSMKSGDGITSARIDQYSRYPCYGGNGLRGFTNRFTHDGSYALIGRQGALCGNVTGVDGKFFASEHAVVVTASQQTDIRWLTFVLGEMRLNRFSESSAQPGLSVSKVLKLRLAAPPTKPEQRAIAEALSDVDGLLGGLDRLIAKKRDLKQAAMQQLLTGQTRLPGFHGEWPMKTMPEVCWFQEGPGVRNTQFTTSGVKLLNGTNIFRGQINLDTTERFISEREANGPYAHFLADAGDIVIACSGISVEKFHEKVAVVSAEHLPFCMNTSTMRFKPHSTSLVRGYLCHFLMSDIFKRQIAPQATGSAQLNFGPLHVSKVTLPLPAVPEQTAITEVLTDMDEEYAPGSLVVNPAPLTITADNQSKQFGAPFTFSGQEFSASGLVNGDTVSSVSLSSPGAPANATVTGSPYAITASNAQGSGLGNYSISYVDGAFSVISSAPPPPTPAILFPVVQDPAAQAQILSLIYPPYSTGAASTPSVAPIDFLFTGAQQSYLDKRNSIALAYAFDNEVVQSEISDLLTKAYAAYGFGPVAPTAEVVANFLLKFKAAWKINAEGHNGNYLRALNDGVGLFSEVFLETVAALSASEGGPVVSATVVSFVDNGLGVTKLAAAFATAYTYGFVWGQ